MLILSRRLGDKIMIGADIEVTVLQINGRQVKLGVQAPPGIDVHRHEVFERIKAGAPSAKKPVVT